jgi:conjugal transfer pilus assembly protein TraE
MSRAENTLIGKSYADYKRERKFFHISGVAQAAAILLLAYFLVTRDEIIIMVPPQLEAETKIVNGEGDAEYQKRFAFSFANLIGNVTPKNVQFIVDQVNASFSPALRDATAQSIENDARILRSRDLKSTFVVEDMLFNDDRNIVWVWGERTIKGDGVPPVSNPYTFEFQIKPVNGFPRILHYDAFEGHPIIQKIKQRGEKLEKRYYTEEQESLATGLEVEVNKGSVDEAEEK